ncbi:GxxExxY protein [Symmachiella dynata]|uniref:GxxExxY protein n=1 Tax=Symmachiella dynata TaxID=2527995 RepID=UPI0011887E79|nr:GxxExxY protein [Symmachiella dynata]QDT51981.1 hypothetical protein Pan258_60780 [Symmachiella dynata]|tara:strand:+ start:399 stop:773 length:375 start_codon:yes stop_codon:yes gene_type:complete
MLLYEKLSSEIFGAAIEVHRQLGPGLLESAYQRCLCHELNLREIPFRKEIELPVQYKGIRLDCAYRIDILVDEKIVLELKAVEQLDKIHEAQLLTYLKLSQKRVGLLMNFNVPLMKHGIKRMAL